MKKLEFLFLVVALSVSFVNTLFAGGIAEAVANGTADGMADDRNKEEEISTSNSNEELIIPEIRENVLTIISPNQQDEISPKIFLNGASINGHPAELIHQDSDKSVYGGPDSVYTPNTKIGVIILGE